MPRTLAVLACCAVLALAACSSSASTAAPSASPVAASTSPTAAPSPSPTAAPSPSPSPTDEASPSPTASPSESEAAAPCKATTTKGAVAVDIIDFGFKPKAIRAKVGQIITFTNTGFEPHTATLDAGGCKTPTIASGRSRGLLFTAAGSYPFHCSIHIQMTGTITIRP